jgi:hypothetical protein
MTVLRSHKKKERVFDPIAKGNREEEPLMRFIWSVTLFAFSAWFVYSIIKDAVCAGVKEALKDLNIHG